MNEDVRRQIQFVNIQRPERHIIMDINIFPTAGHRTQSPDYII